MAQRVGRARASLYGGLTAVATRRREAAPAVPDRRSSLVRHVRGRHRGHGPPRTDRSTCAGRSPARHHSSSTRAAWRSRSRCPPSRRRRWPARAPSSACSAWPSRPSSSPAWRPVAGRRPASSSRSAPAHRRRPRPTVPSPAPRRPRRREPTTAAPAATPKATAKPSPTLVPTGPSASPTASAAPPTTYKVKRGDTLSGIAAKFATTVKVLVRAQRHQGSFEAAHRAGHQAALILELNAGSPGNRT